MNGYGVLLSASDVIDVSAMCERFCKESDRAPFGKKIKSKDLSEKFNALRKFYGMAKEQIFAAGRNEWGIDPYEVDWVPVFTPIEYGLWHDIRDCNAVFYPQYPVGRFFVDFANPVAKIAIECDGAAYHQDQAKDAARQKEIEALGWRVFRITGRDCMSQFDEQEMQVSASMVFIKRICNDYGVSRNSQWADCEV